MKTGERSARGFPIATLKLPFGTVHYSDQGSGPPVVLLHANPGDSRDYDAIIPALSRDHRVLALDWPAYGQSDMPPQPQDITLHFFDEVLRQFLTALALPPAMLIGNSLGGNVAARLAIESPDQVRGLVLVSPGGFTPHTTVTRSFCALQGSRFSLTPLRWASLYLKQHTLTASQMLKRAQDEQSDPQRVALNRAVWRNFARPEHDLRERAGRITAPTLLVFGEQDPAIPASKDGKEAARCIPNAQTVVLPCGHAAFAEMPDRFLTVVLPFLAAYR